MEHSESNLRYWRWRWWFVLGVGDRKEVWVAHLGYWSHVASLCENSSNWWKEHGYILLYVCYTSIKPLKYTSRTDAVDSLMCNGVRKGGWPGGHCQGMEPRKTHGGGNGKSQGLHKESRGNTAPPQRNWGPENRWGKNRKRLTHLADGLSCGEVPSTQHVHMDRAVLAFSISVKEFIELVLNEAHIPSWRWKGSSRGALKISRKSGKDAIAELQSSALSVSMALQCGVFSTQAELSSLFQTSIYA